MSRGGGETFHAIGEPLHDVHRLASGWYASYLDDSCEEPIAGYLSEDGLTWRPVRVPHPRS